MALEINEIGIRVQVYDDAGRPAQRLSESSGSANLDREQLIEECVRKVLQALKALGER
jgi:hypothetical protein